MKCRECDACEKGWFESRPNDYVCIGVKHPFVIKDINAECTEYEYKSTTRGTTNADRIRSMSNKRLAEFLATLNGGGSVRCEWFLKWLNERAEE